MENEYLTKLVEVEQRSKSNMKRLDDVEAEVKENRELTVAVKEIATEMKHLREEQTDMNKRLKIIEEKPLKNWENLIKIIVTRNCNSSSGFLFGKVRVVEGSEKYEKINRNITN